MLTSGPIIESKGMHAFFRKRAKYLKNLGKTVQNFKIFFKKTASCVRLSHA